MACLEPLARVEFCAGQDSTLFNDGSWVMLDFMAV